MSDLYLAHHGIKGMKWGVRRFEDASGHLTPAGKRRYGVQDARKYYKINRLQRYREKTNNPKIKKLLSGEIRRTQTRSDRKHSDLNQKDINIGREIVAKHRLKWASVNTAAKTALTAAGAAYLYSNPKTRALAPVALAGGAALTYGSAKKIPYYFMENHRYKQVNPKGGTQRGLTKRQQQFRKVGKAAVGAALAGAAGYALIKSGAVQQVANRYRNANGSGPSIATQAVMDANKQASKAKKSADRRERFKTAVSQKVRSTASAGTRKAVGALKSRIVPTIDEDDPSTWVNAVRSTGGLLNNIRTNGVKRTAVNMATETAMDGGKYVVDRVGSKVHNVRSRIKNRRKKNN